MKCETAQLCAVLWLSHQSKSRLFSVRVHRWRPAIQRFGAAAPYRQDPALEPGTAAKHTRCFSGIR
jgi:hypothetical protein